MSSFQSPSSFTEDDTIFVNVPEHWLNPKKMINKFRDELERAYNSTKANLDELYQRINLKRQSLDDKIKKLSEQVQHLEDEKSQLRAKIIHAKQKLLEIQLKKKTLEEENNVPQISEEELKKMLEEAVILEKENELKLEELKKTKYALVGRMCFFKEFLDVYIDIIGENDYILYFKRCSGTDSKRPEEWIRIMTDNFEEYSLADVSFPEGSKERGELLKLHEDGAPLRQLIYNARQKCLNGSKKK